MQTKLLLRHLDIASNASEGYATLRKVVLDSAISGLLSKGASERQSMTKLLSTLPPHEVDEVYVPSSEGLRARVPNHALVKFKNIGKWAGGNGFPTVEQGLKDEEFLFCKVSDMNRVGNEKYILTTENSISDETRRRLKVKAHPVGTVVFPKIGGAIATNKRRILTRPTAIDNNCMGLIPCRHISPEWLHILLSSIDMAEYQTGTSIPSISHRVLDEIQFLVPPPSVQDQVVEKVGELMILIDQLEKENHIRDNLQESALASAIDSLTSSKTAVELKKNWRQFESSWEILLSNSESVEYLRALILELAVKGTLSPFRSPTKLAPISWNCEELKLQEGKLWKLPTAAAVTREGWNRLPLARLGQWGSGGTPTATRKEYYKNGTIPWAVIGDLNGGTLTATESKITKRALASSSTKLIPVGSVLIAMYGASIGKVSITGIECATNQAIAHCIPDGKIISREYLLLVAKSLKRHLVAVGKGAAQPNISQTVLRHLLIDIPPLKEQFHIISLVNDLFDYCDQLELQLRTREVLATEFIKSIASKR